MTPWDGVGLVGVVLILGAYGLTTVGRIDPTRAPALMANFVGASLVLVSLAFDFNLSAVIVEGAWALIALGGLLRLAFRRARRPSRPAS